MLNLRARVPLLLGMAAVLGLLLRLYIIWHFPISDSDDTRIYDELARNWLSHGTYGQVLDGRLTPVNLRVPGYPAFLAAVYSLYGHSAMAVMLVQALLDLLTCWLCAALASRLAPPESQPRVGAMAYCLAALCPFTANYTAVLLTETLAALLTSLSLCLLLEAFASLDSAGVHLAGGSGPRLFMKWATAAFIVGLGALVRPETPLLLAVAGILVAWRCWRPPDWRKLLNVGLACALGLILPLAPWAWRNYRTLGEVQFLAPRYADLPGEYVPRGFYSWTATWLVRFADVYTVPWRNENDAIQFQDIPAEAFDSPAESARVAALILSQNQARKITPEIDAGFAQLARERTARHPLRTWLTVPLGRVLTIWFTPRVELLPYSGKLWPLREKWREDPLDVSVTLAFGGLSFIYAGLALHGAWRARHNSATLFLVAVIFIRTLFLTQLETPEPRYLIPVFPALLALAAQSWVKKP